MALGVLPDTCLGVPTDQWCSAKTLVIGRWGRWATSPSVTDQWCSEKCAEKDLWALGDGHWAMEKRTFGWFSRGLVFSWRKRPLVGFSGWFSWLDCRFEDWTKLAKRPLVVFRIARTTSTSGCHLTQSRREQAVFASPRGHIYGTATFRRKGTRLLNARTAALARTTSIRPRTFRNSMTTLTSSTSTTSPAMLQSLE